MLAATLVGVGAGCRVQGQATVTEPVATVEVDEAPPPPRNVVVESRPGFVFIEGRWSRRNNQWAWNDGHWERERSGQSWVSGRWEQRGNKHVYVEGRWQAGGGNREVVRDHREAPPAAPPPAEDTVVRDHRH
ncbi:MAG TPA: hypothetical protein VGC42_30350 [Kofleriaceae bacterium]